MGGFFFVFVKCDLANVQNIVLLCIFMIIVNIPLPSHTEFMLTSLLVVLAVLNKALKLTSVQYSTVRDIA